MLTYRHWKSSSDSAPVAFGDLTDDQNQKPQTSKEDVDNLAYEDMKQNNDFVKNVCSDLEEIRSPTMRQVEESCNTSNLTKPNKYKVYIYFLGQLSRLDIAIGNCKRLLPYAW